MRTVNIHAAKTHLSKLVEEVAGGEEVVIARAGRPMAKLVPFEAPKGRQPGILRGKIELKPGWDQPWDEEFIKLFEEGDPDHPSVLDEYLEELREREAAREPNPLVRKAKE